MNEGEDILFAKLKKAIQQLNAVIIGKEEIVQKAMICILARGHLLLEDLPGSGKTTLARAMAKTLGLDYQRVQFTSDLLPSDIIGFSMYHQHSERFEFHPGPIFTQLLLADEINRASPKSQSALLEAMEERQVSVDRHTHLLPQPFFVIATQNPLEQFGTYPLPESQQDRFMLRLQLGYLNAASEIELLQGQSHADLLQALPHQLTPEDLLALHARVNAIYIQPHCARYVQALLDYTRHSGLFLHGLSTRAGLALIQAARAMAYVQGEEAVLPQHVQAMFCEVAWHRLQGGHDKEQHAALLQEVLSAVVVPV